MANDVTILEFLLAQNEEAQKEPMTQYEAFYLKGKKDLINDILTQFYGKDTQKNKP